MLPAVETKYLRVHIEGSLSRSGNLPKNTALLLLTPVLCGAKVELKEVDVGDQV